MIRHRFILGEIIQLQMLKTTEKQNENGYSVFFSQRGMKYFGIYKIYVIRFNDEYA